MRASMIVAACALAAACGTDKVDLAGMYEVTHHTLNQADCNLEGAEVDEPPYILMEEGELFGQAFYTMADCASADPGSCTGGGLLFGLSFTQPVDDGWEGWVSAALGSGDPCTLSYQEQSAILESETNLRIEVRAWGEEGVLAEDDCTSDEAKSRAKDMPCTRNEVIAGTRLGA